MYVQAFFSFKKITVETMFDSNSFIDGKLYYEKEHVHVQQWNKHFFFTRFSDSVFSEQDEMMIIDILVILFAIKVHIMFGV